ncbi:MAG: FAD-dependent oxidoreductase, partial [Candidatus Omnitrophota bacterium]|nr:FAD-dependent oxidoreductase [Candidatus Omnitrophota bacterium]
VFTDFEVSKIINSNVEGRDSSGKLTSLSADIIVSTIPPPILNNILNLPDEVKSQLSKIQYKSFISFVCGSTQNISQHYWSVVLKPHLIFGGFFNHTVLSPSNSINDKSVYYFFRYLESNDPLFNYDDDKIKDIYLKDIRSLFANFSLDWYKIFRLKFSEPIFVYNYKNLPIEFIDNIYLAGAYRQYPKPGSMDAALYSGFETAQYIINKYGKS